MFDSLIRTALTTTLSTTELVLTRSLEVVQMVNRALGTPVGHEHEEHRALTRDSVVRREPSWRPPELGDLDTTAAALANRTRSGPAVTSTGSVRPPRAAMRRPAAPTARTAPAGTGATTTSDQPPVSSPAPAKTTKATARKRAAKKPAAPDGGEE